jgi:hypothetical protein
MKWLVGGAITILKNMKVNGKDYPIYEMENKKCLKPPTRWDVSYDRWNRIGFWSS